MVHREPYLAVEGYLRDPRTSDATLEIFGRSAGDGTTGVLHLDAVRWRALGNPEGSRSWKYLDPASTNGVRKVADELEAEWNRRLRALTDAQEEYEHQRQADHAIPDDAQRTRILALASDLPTLWEAPTTPDRDRKRMLRLLVEDVTLHKGEQLMAHVRFRGGATTTLTLPPGAERVAAPPDEP